MGSGSHDGQHRIEDFHHLQNLYWTALERLKCDIWEATTQLKHLLSTSSASTLGAAGELLSSRGSQTRQKAIGRDKRQQEVPRGVSRTLSVLQNRSKSHDTKKRSACPSHVLLVQKQGFPVSSWRCCLDVGGSAPHVLEAPQAKHTESRVGLKSSPSVSGLLCSALASLIPNTLL